MPHMCSTTVPVPPASCHGSTFSLRDLPPTGSVCVLPHLRPPGLGPITWHIVTVMSLRLASWPSCMHAAHLSKLPFSTRRMRSTSAAVHSGNLPVPSARLTPAVTVRQWRPPLRSFPAATPAVAFVLAGPAISLVPVWFSSAVAPAAATAVASVTCRARALSAAPPRVSSRSAFCGLATGVHPVEAARGMATAAVNSWAAVGTPFAWPPRLGGGRDVAATAVGMILGEQRAMKSGGDGDNRRGGRGGRGSGTPSPLFATQSRAVSSASKRAPRSRRSAGAKARRAVPQASSGSAGKGGGDGDASLMKSPSLGMPVVVPTAALAVRVSDKTCAAVERLLGYRFKSQATLREAMSHASLDQETRSAAGLGARDNERLEWLGDGTLLSGRWGWWGPRRLCPVCGLLGC